MRITNIKPIEKGTELCHIIDQELGKTFIVDRRFSGSMLIVCFKLRENKPQITRYALSPNYHIEEETLKSGKKRLVAVCNIMKDLRMPIKKGSNPQEEDWIQINQTLNKICDQLGISCTIRSKIMKIRDGKENVWISNYETLLDQKKIYHSEAFETAVEMASVTEKYSFGQVFSSGLVSSPIPNRVLEDYDDLDNLAKSRGYYATKDPKLCGWIATMSDSCHNSEKMLEEANEKLEAAKSMKKDVIIGFAQTGNFSVGYTIYVKQ